MNAKSTLALVLLAAFAGVWLWKGEEWGPRWIKSSRSEPAASPGVTVLDSLSSAALSRVEVAFASGDPLILERTNSEFGWKLPGNWPPRKPEVEELVSLLGNLRTRFHAIPIGADTDLAPYGLAPDQKPLIVKLIANDQPYTLTFGDPTPAAGETAFTRPAYVRINDFPELLQLGPDVMPILRRPADAYRRRQLFTDVERIKTTAALPTPSPLGPPGEGEGTVTITIPGAETASIQVSRPTLRLFGIPAQPLEGTFTLTRTGPLPEPGVYEKNGEPTIPPNRLADSWALQFPIRDHVEPARLRSLLTSVADLWVDQFVSASEFEKTTDLRLLIAQQLVLPISLDSGLLLASPLLSQIPLETRTGLADSRYAISVKPIRGEAVTVRFGGFAKMGEREQTISIPAGPPGTPPQSITQKTPILYRFAKVDGNPQIFVVQAEKFAELFPSANQLVDPQVARVRADEIQEVVVAHSGAPQVKLIRKKGDPKAGNPADRMDRWLVDARPNPFPADAARVNELLDQLAGFHSDGPDAATYPKTPLVADTHIIIVAKEKRAEGEPEAPARTIQLEIGKPDLIKRLLQVQLAGWPRVTRVSDRRGPDEPDSWIGSLLFPNSVSALFDRTPVAYRGRKLLDTTDSTLSDLKVSLGAGGFALQKSSLGEWMLTSPRLSTADPGKADQLVTALTGLETTEYLTDSPSADELKTYGLEKPGQAATMVFTNGRTYKLELGGPRPGKPEVFARLDGGAVFGLPSSIVEQLTTGVIGLLPLRIWAAQPGKLTSIQLAYAPDSPNKSFTLNKDGQKWKLSGPFTAEVSDANARAFLTTLGTLRAVKYEAMSVANEADYGFDKPLARVTVSFMEPKSPAAGEQGGATEQAVSKTIKIGKPTPDNTGSYARLDEANAPVFIVPKTFALGAETSPLDLLDRSLLALEPSRIAKVQLVTQKQEDALTLTKNATGTWSVEGIAFPVDVERISNLTLTLGILPINRLVAYGDAIKLSDYGLDKPAATITVTESLDKPIAHTIALGNVDPSGAQFARIDNGKAVGLISGQAAETLIRKKFDYADRALLRFDATTLTSLNRKQGKDELEVATGAAVGWDLIKPAKNKADQPFVEELADILGRLRAERIVAFGKKEEMYKKYGLEPPAAVLTLTVGEKAEQKVLRLGNPTDAAKPEGERYATVETPGAEASIGVLPANLAGKLLASEITFRDHTLAKFLDADKVVLDRGDRKITIAKAGVTWKLTEPLAAAAESSELDALVADLGKLRVDAWLAKKSVDLKEFGLDKPQARWALFDGDKPVLTLLVGKKQADGRACVTTDKSELVGVLDVPMTTRVLAEYRQRRPWEVDAAQVEAVELTRGETRFTLQKAGPAWFDPMKADDLIDVRVVNELLGTLGALRVDHYAADVKADLKLYGLEKPELRITVTAQGGVKRVLEIGAVVGGTEGKQRYARVVDKDRADVFVLAAADTQRLLRERAEYAIRR